MGKGRFRPDTIARNPADAVIICIISLNNWYKLLVTVDVQAPELSLNPGLQVTHTDPYALTHASQLSTEQLTTVSVIFLLTGPVTSEIAALTLNMYTMSTVALGAVTLRTPVAELIATNEGSGYKLYAAIENEIEVDPDGLEVKSGAKVELKFSIMLKSWSLVWK